MKPLPRQVFTKEFRVEAVKLVIEQGLTQMEVARRLKLSDKTLNRWVVLSRAGKLAGVDAKRTVPVGSLEAELSQLKKEIAVLREERDILKKRRHSLRTYRGEVCLY